MLLSFPDRRKIQAEGHRTQLCTLLLFFAKIKGIMNAYIVY
jgi:hypothetical protein